MDTRGKGPTPEASQWERLRFLVKTKHPGLWAGMRSLRHFVNDERAELREHGWRAVASHVRRIAREMELPKPKSKRSRLVWLDLGALGSLTRYEGDDWQDHGMGLLRTIMHREGLPTELVSVRNAKTWDDVTRQLRDFDVLLMNVRSYSFDSALKSARIFKQVNPRGQIFVGGMHTMVSPETVETCLDFDRICRGPGEGVIADLVRDPAAFSRVFEGKAAASDGDWGKIDRTLWPKPANWLTRFRFNWPLERGTSWGPQPQRQS